MNSIEQLTTLIGNALKALELPETSIILEHPGDVTHGDFATSVAMQLAKTQKKNPRALAQEIADHINTQLPTWLKPVTVAGPGFINFSFAPEFFAEVVAGIDENFGKNTRLTGKKAIVEYTDPNPFKALHIGHLMSNTVGESLSRIIEWSGAETMRACYQGDVGMHVAKTIWGLQSLGIANIPYAADIYAQVDYIGKAYAHGATVYEEGDASTVAAMKGLNKAIYTRTEKEINELYDWGKQVSLEYFELQYRMLGTQHDHAKNKAFNFYFFESETGVLGKKIVEEFLGKGIFKKSDNAVVFPGEDYGLHTRVFLNSEGLPTYEAKELGLAHIKYDRYPYDLSVVVTGNEIREYFKVLMAALGVVNPALREKTVHVPHGMLRLPSGKMSSRTGKVVTAEELITEVKERVAEYEGRKMDEATVSAIAVAAIKYSVLRQAAGKDIVFNMETSVSFEGDSGPYLQYTYVRCQSILHKAHEAGLRPDAALPLAWETLDLERQLYQFPEIVAQSLTEYSSHCIANYLTALAHDFNSWYGNTKILDTGNPATAYRLSLTRACAQTVKNGLWLLGIEAPEQM